MCRSNELGGRRCPLHSNPTYIANRNERRRAQYAKNKGGKVRDYNKKTVDNNLSKITEITNLGDTSHPLFTGLEADQLGTPDETYRLSSEKAKYHDDLGITTHMVEGNLVDANYFTSTVPSGVIDYSNLNETSYKKFGFKGSDEVRDYDREMGLDIVLNSSHELKNMSLEQGIAMGHYVGPHYKWISNALYGKGYREDELPDIESVESWDDAYLGEDYEEDYPESYQGSPKFLEENIVPALDSLISSGPGKARIVYRGQGPNRAQFGIGKNGETPATSWVKENISLGQEMVFDSYQSTSLDPETAIGYSQENGVIYEILTPEGIGTTSLSDWTEEAEVTLPRGSRYMVVGIHQGKQYQAADSRLASANIVQLVAINEKGAILTSDNRHVVPQLTEKQLNLS